jgi:fructan beta-fructosidase
MACKVLLIISFGFTCLLPLKSAAQSTSYQELYRPQYHFSPQNNWINDPCGMVYHNGEYHLLYQYNPFGTQWGSMSWGHAVSKDMVHWEELPVALYPDAQGQIFSGGAVVDHNNTAGFGAGALVAIYTSAGATQKQSIAYSTNNGRTWRKYSGNPVLPNQGIADFRDPQVFWHPGSGKWVMTLAVLDRIEFYSSPNLKNWTFESDFGRGIGAQGGVWECPDLFPLKVQGREESQWVLMVSLNPGSPSGGSGTQYFLGNFDGKRFTLTEEFSALIGGELELPQGVLFEDFEGSSYGNWTVEGTAFGAKPAAGTLPGQQQVSGYLGQQLVNSYLNGDVSQGKLTSAAFTIEHDYINFLIGGGNLPGQAEVRLLINGQVVATATGQNAEKLRWKHWDVKQHHGAQATIQIADEATGGWGHINVDHIYFANEPIESEGDKAFWADYGPDFYAGRSWENQPAGTYERVWLAWMSNWAYAGALPTSNWRGSMSLPRYMELRTNANGAVRLYQNPVNELQKLRQPAVLLPNLPVAQLNGQLQERQLRGTNYELSFTLVPGATADKAGVLVRKGPSEQTEIGYDPMRQAIYIDRSRSGSSFSGEYTQVFYAPLETSQQELHFRIFVDESSVEVFVNDGAIVQTAVIFPTAQSDQVAFFGASDAQVQAFDFRKLQSIWQPNQTLSAGKDFASDGITIYPNPAKGSIRVECEQEVENIELYTLTGQQLPVHLVRHDKSVSVLIPESNAPGLFLLTVHLKNGQVLVKKVMLE